MINASDQLPHGLLLSKYLSALCILNHLLLLSDGRLIDGTYELLQKNLPVRVPMTIRLYPRQTDWTLNSGLSTACWGSTSFASEKVFNLSRDLMFERCSTL
jgi:hypothetical protein